VEASAARAYAASRLRVLLTCVGLVLMLALAVDIVRNIYRGVEGLRDLTDSMRRHDYDAEPRFRASGELGQVLDGFLEMRDDVRRFESGLNEQLLHTESMRASLERSEVFQRSLLEAAQVAVVSMDLAGRITSCNPFAERLTGYAAAEMEGQPGLEWLTRPGELERLAGQLELALDRTVPAGARLVALMVDLDLPRPSGRSCARTAPRCRCCWRPRRCAAPTVRWSASSAWPPTSPTSSSSSSGCAPAKQRRATRAWPRARSLR
jgi:PAS domain-containing protein